LGLGFDCIPSVSSGRHPELVVHSTQEVNAAIQPDSTSAAGLGQILMEGEDAGMPYIHSSFCRGPDKALESVVFAVYDGDGLYG
jgi:hypothetical protein